jgi:hypothetical protein
MGNWCSLLRELLKGRVEVPFFHLVAAVMPSAGIQYQQILSSWSEIPSRAPARCRTRPCDSPGATPPSANFLVCEPHKTAEAPRPRRRGDRVGQLLSGVAVHEFAHGTSTTLGEV